MAVTVRGTNKGGTSSAVPSMSVSTPSSTASGDQILAAFAVKGATNSQVVPPDGTWTQVGSKAYPSLGVLRIFAKTATAAGAQPFTFTTTDIGGTSASLVTEWICHVVTGQGSVELLSPTGANGTTSPVTTAGITTSENNEYLVRFVGGYVGVGTSDEKSSTWTSPATLLANAQGTNGTGAGLSWISASDETGPSTAGSVAGRVLTLQSAPSGWASLTVGVKVPTVTPPTSTGAPAISGTASVGSVLSLTTAGTWDQSVSLAYQWQRDGSNISGATSTTYTLVSGDAGHTIRVVETATNGASATATANSNGIAVPSAPVNTVAPAISGPNTPALTGDPLTVAPGTYTGTGIALTYQWYRGTSPISGQTATTYVLVTSDEGANITVRETATNGGGTATADSNVITPSVTAPISDASFLTYLSGGTGNTDPSLSYGGARGGTMPVALNALFGPILGTVAQAGGTLYRVIYVRNTHTTATAAGCKLFLEQQYDPTSGMTLSVAVPTQAVNTTVPALASGTTAPSGVTWTSATTSGTGRTFGDLGPGDYRGVYVRLVIAAGAPQTSEVDAIIAVEGSAA